MNVRPYTANDLQEINGWHRARGFLPVELDTLPPTGLIVPGVAVGFLYRTDSQLGMLDGFISNPEAPKEQRAAALMHIGQVLADSFQGKHLLVYTGHSGIARWCREHSFQPRGSHVLFSRTR